MHAAYVHALRYVSVYALNERLANDKNDMKIKSKEKNMCASWMFNLKSISRLLDKCVCVFV